jgi:hypothetical protein
MAPSYIDLRSDTVTKPTPEMLEAVSHLDRSNLAMMSSAKMNLQKNLNRRSLTCWEKKLGYLCQAARWQINWQLKLAHKKAMK